MDAQTNAAKRFTPATVVGVSNDVLTYGRPIIRFYACLFFIQSSVIILGTFPHNVIRFSVENLLCRFSQSATKMYKGQKRQICTFFRGNASQFAPLFQNTKVGPKSKTIISIANDSAIIVSNFVVVGQKRQRSMR